MGEGFRACHIPKGGGMEIERVLSLLGPLEVEIYDIKKPKSVVKPDSLKNRVTNLTTEVIQSVLDLVGDRKGKRGEEGRKERERERREGGRKENKGGRKESKRGREGGKEEGRKENKGGREGERKELRRELRGRRERKGGREGFPLLPPKFPQGNSMGKPAGSQQPHLLRLQPPLPPLGILFPRLGKEISLKRWPSRGQVVFRCLCQHCQLSVVAAAFPCSLLPVLIRYKPSGVLEVISCLSSRQEREGRKELGREGGRDGERKGGREERIREGGRE
ncbi:hypothetical protein L345_16527, partial [Ophiophagus hannah]